jgi:hypothetical protein
MATDAGTGRGCRTPVSVKGCKNEDNQDKRTPCDYDSLKKNIGLHLFTI